MHEFRLVSIIIKILICFFYKADAFKRGTERLVNDLKKSSQFVEERLENIEERSENLLQSSKDIRDSLKCNEGVEEH